MLLIYRLWATHTLQWSLGQSKILLTAKNLTVESTWLNPNNSDRTWSKIQILSIFAGWGVISFFTITKILRVWVSCLWLKFNQAFLAKQAWRILSGQNSLVARDMEAHYFSSGHFMEAARSSSCSHIWCGLLQGQD